MKIISLTKAFDFGGMEEQLPKLDTMTSTGEAGEDLETMTVSFSDTDADTVTIIEELKKAGFPNPEQGVFTIRNDFENERTYITQDNPTVTE